MGNKWIFRIVDPIIFAQKNLQYSLKKSSFRHPRESGDPEKRERRKREKTGKKRGQAQNVPALGSRLRGNDGKEAEPERIHSLMPFGKLRICLYLFLNLYHVVPYLDTPI
jgi:hypothetical protein